MTMYNTEQQLVIHHLSFERNNQYLFRNLQQTIKSGELLQVQGANGSGKSTLLRILAGYLIPQEGRIQWSNPSLQEQNHTCSQHLHYIGHRNGIKPALTTTENMKLNCALHNIPFHPQQVKVILQKTGLQHAADKPASQLSAGQLRRLALTRLLLRDSQLWILDEPTTALDKEGQSLLSTLLTEHLTKGGMAIVATHQNLGLSRTLKTLQLGGEYA